MYPVSAADVQRMTPPAGCTVWLVCLSDLVQVLSSCQCIHKYAQSRTGYRMMVPAVPELSASSLHTHTHSLTYKHRHTHIHTGGGRVKLRQKGICGDGWHTDHKIKKALGLRSGFTGRQCVSDDVRLNGWASVGFTVFSIKSDCQIVSSQLHCFSPWNTITV